MNKIALFLTAAMLATVFSTPIFAEESAITPDGNLDVTDDLNSDGRQFLTVQTRSGAEFYIIIERNRDAENVYFLNQVDDKDLFAILAANKEELICDCAEKCAVGSVNTACELCSLDRESCEGIEPEPTTEIPTSETSYSAVSIVIAIALLIAVVVIFIKFRKSKPAPKPPNFDDSDDDVEDEIEDEVEIETEDEE